MLLALTLAIVGTMSAIPVFWQMPNRFLAGTAAAGGVALINSIANLAGFGAPWMLGLIKTATGSLAPGLYVVAAVEICATLLILAFVPRVPQAADRRRRAGALIPPANREKSDPCQPPRLPFDLAALNAMDRDAFVAALGADLRELAVGRRWCVVRTSLCQRRRRCMPRCWTWSAARRRNASSPSCAAIRNWPAARRRPAR